MEAISVPFRKTEYVNGVPGLTELVIAQLKALTGLPDEQTLAIGTRLRLAVTGAGAQSLLPVTDFGELVVVPELLLALSE